MCEERAGPAGSLSDTEQDPEQDPELDCSYRDLAHVKPALLPSGDDADEELQLCPQAESKLFVLNVAQCLFDYPTDLPHLLFILRKSLDSLCPLRVVLQSPRVHPVCLRC